MFNHYIPSISIRLRPVYFFKCCWPSLGFSVDCSTTYDDNGELKARGFIPEVAKIGTVEELVKALDIDNLCIPRSLREKWMKGEARDNVLQ